MKKTTNDYMLEKICELLEPEDRGELLDIGPGTGMNCRMFYKMGFKVEICDYDNNILRKLKEFKGKQADLNKQKLPYKNNEFDIIVAMEVIEHLENSWHLIREIKRVLKPKGKLILSTPYIDSLIQRLWFLVTGSFLRISNKADSRGHITPMHLNVIKSILRLNNFNIEKITFERSWIPIVRLTLPPNALLGYTLIIKATNN